MPTLRFQNGKFKILHFTDIQDSWPVMPEAIQLMEAALDKEKPDLVVFTGDQIAGYSGKLKGQDGAANIRSVIKTILAPLEAREVPFVFTFGNHDKHSSMPLPEQFAIYAESPLCCNVNTPPPEGVTEDAFGTGNCNVPILGADGKVKFSIYALDSHGSAGVLGYAPLDASQVEWYKQTRDKMEAINGTPVPSLLFQHIPVPEVYDVLAVVPKSKTAIQGFRNHGDKYYALDPDNCEEGSVFAEMACVPDTNSGLLDAAAEKGEVLGMYFGHDHKNTFAGVTKGIKLGYTPGVCFSSYGPGLHRGCRVIELDEADLSDYKTRVYTAKQLLGADFTLPLASKFWDMTPTSGEDFKKRFLPWIIGGLLLITLLIIVAVTTP
ncbi:MAG: metallophosphoesterase family protein [Oscillospiraceae bacterium]|jgi:predicted phosphodiesterase|nr:metallophosphoesterase family protein [Oscillospiraceae bacterium]